MSGSICRRSRRLNLSGFMGSASFLEVKGGASVGGQGLAAPQHRGEGVSFILGSVGGIVSEVMGYGSPASRR